MFFSGDALSDKISNISIDDRFDDSCISNRVENNSRSNSVSSANKKADMTNSVSKVQLLKRKKEELEKKLNEKYNQLQQVCREVRFHKFFQKNQIIIIFFFRRLR